MVDEQQAWQVSIYQGDDPHALNNLLVGRFLAEGFSRVPAGNEILCRMDLDLDGILKVTAVEKRTDLAKQITIEGATTALSEAEVAHARQRVQELFGDEAVGAGAEPRAEPDRAVEPETASPAGDVTGAEARTLLQR